MGKQKEPGGNNFLPLNWRSRSPANKNFLEKTRLVHVQKSYVFSVGLKVVGGKGRQKRGDL